MNSKIINAEKRINLSCYKAGITPQGQTWMEHALDPFKDIPEKCAGYPDTDCGTSLIHVYKQSATITAPASAAGGAWDCNVFLDSLPVPINLVTSTITNGTTARVGQGATTYATGGLTARTGPAGVGLPLNTLGQSMGFDPTFYTNSSGRMIAQGFEVHNVTAEVNLQGQVCYYRIPSEDETPKTVNVTENFGTTACIPSSYPLNPLPSIPETLAAAVLLPGSIQTEAKHGAYIVGVLADQANPAKTLANMGVARTDLGGQQYFPQITATGANNWESIVPRTQVVPFCVGGAFFTGLSNQTSLVVNVNWIFERFVGANSTNDLTTLASPSAPFDPKCLEVYSQVAKTLATGVPVNENGFGDWISGIASTISKYAGPVLSGIGSALNGVNDRDERREAYLNDPSVARELIDLRRMRDNLPPITQEVKQEVKREVKKEETKKKKKKEKKKNDDKSMSANPKRNNFNQASFRRDTRPRPSYEQQYYSGPLPRRNDSYRPSNFSPNNTKPWYSFGPPSNGGGNYRGYY